MSYFKYDKFFELAKKKKIKVMTDMVKRDKVIPSNAYMKMLHNNGHITTKTICAICDYMNCKPKDIMEFVKGDRDAVD